MRKQPGVSLSADRNRPLPVLSIQPPASPLDELPDLKMSVGPGGSRGRWSRGHYTSVRELLGRKSSGVTRRSVCPRRLAPGRAYLACLVPAFASGRKAGLGETVTVEDESQLAPAWVSRARGRRSFGTPGLLPLGIQHRTGKAIDSSVRR